MRDKPAMQAGPGSWREKFLDDPLRLLYNFFSVCCMPCSVRLACLAASLLTRSPTALVSPLTQKKRLRMNDGQKGSTMKALSIPILLILALANLQAQSTSSLTGLVTDPSGGVVPGAEIVAVNSETNQKRTATTDSQGRYSFPQMQPATYQVTAQATGFSAAVVNDVRLLVNTPTTVDIHFTVGAVQQSVSVTADTVQV